MNFCLLRMAFLYVTVGSHTTITMNSEGEATNVVVFSMAGFGRFSQSE